jgi:hypothetical protein
MLSRAKATGVASTESEKLSDSSRWGTTSAVQLPSACCARATGTAPVTLPVTCGARVAACRCQRWALAQPSRLLQPSCLRATERSASRCVHLVAPGSRAAHRQRHVGHAQRHQAKAVLQREHSVQPVADPGAVVAQRHGGGGGSGQRDGGVDLQAAGDGVQRRVVGVPELHAHVPDAWPWEQQGRHVGAVAAGPAAVGDDGAAGAGGQGSGDLAAQAGAGPEAAAAGPDWQDVERVLGRGRGGHGGGGVGDVGAGERAKGLQLHHLHMSGRRAMLPGQQAADERRSSVPGGDCRRRTG